MTINVKIKCRGTDELRAKVGNPVAVVQAGCEALANTVKRHLMRLNRHATRQALDARSNSHATPTQHYRKGAAAVHVTTESDGAAVIIPIPGIARAFKPLDLSPRNAKALTIPLNSIAYGRRASELGRFGWRLFRGRGKARGILFGARDGEVRGLYALKSHVRQPADRSLLPSDRQMVAALAHGARMYLDTLKDK